MPAADNGDPAYCAFPFPRSGIGMGSPSPVEVETVIPSESDANTTTPEYGQSAHRKDGGASSTWAPSPPAPPLGFPLHLCDNAGRQAVLCTPFSHGGGLSSAVGAAGAIGGQASIMPVPDSNEIVLKSVKFAPWAEAVTFDGVHEKARVPGSPKRNLSEPWEKSSGFPKTAAEQARSGSRPRAPPSFPDPSLDFAPGPNLAAAFTTTPTGNIKGEQDEDSKTGSEKSSIMAAAVARGGSLGGARHLEERQAPVRHSLESRTAQVAGGCRGGAHAPRGEQQGLPAPAKTTSPSSKVERRDGRNSLFERGRELFGRLYKTTT